VIPRAQITAWRASAPWPTDAQVEQDLVLSRAVVELFTDPTVAETMAFRGGTALHKLFLVPPGRYSEDIDLVQVNAGPIGSALDAIRATLDPWLGEPRRKQGPGRVTLLYRFETTSRPVQPMRLKIEINTREHFTVLGALRRKLTVGSDWFAGAVDINTYEIEELLGTKLRALYQRRKGRDLYDLWLALTTLDADVAKVVECFERYMDHGCTPVSRAEFEANLAAKLRSKQFLEDIEPLLPNDVTYDVAVADAHVREHLLAKLRGDPWKGEGV
jgi:predicted nucleotidyltransferase component of viral defense system